MAGTFPTQRDKSVSHLQAIKESRRYMQFFWTKNASVWEPRVISDPVSYYSVRYDAAVWNV